MGIAVASPVAPVDGRGQPIGLGPLVGRGGEGAVYAVDGRPDIVAKQYHRPPGPDLAAKLAAMAALQTPDLITVAAWPVGTLHDPSSGTVIGLLMPRIVDHKPIHQLYGPKSRLVEFPSADFRFLVHAAANLARAFAVVHGHGHVVGDVNHANALVDARAIVRLIDCDSFQVAAPGRVFSCDVGVPTHQPPEVQRLASLRGLVRAPSHDCFGLAVLVFQLLLLGRHPFAGQYLGTGDMPIERAIRENRFAYGPGAATRQMRPPPYTPPLDALTLPIAAMFERAFGPAGEAGKRPTAAEWVTALETLAIDLADCRQRAGHVYPRASAACPWCDVEARLSARLFPLVAVPPPAPTFDLAAIWAAIEAVSSPGPAPTLPSSRLGNPRQPSEEARRLGQKRRRRRQATAFAAVVGLTLFFAGLAAGNVASLLAAVGVGFAGFALGRSRASAELARFEEDRTDALQRCRQVLARFTNEAGEGPFARKLRELSQARQGYLDLPARRQRERRRLESEPRQRQRERHLETYRIADARVKGLGPGRKATLASYGIETAADVTETALAALPPLGPSLVQPLLDWRRQLEASFPSEPDRPPDPSDLENLDRELQALRGTLEATLKQGPAELRAIARATRRTRFTLQPILIRACRERDQAEANWFAANR